MALATFFPRVLITVTTLGRDRQEWPWLLTFSGSLSQYHSYYGREEYAGPGVALATYFPRILITTLGRDRQEWPWLLTFSGSLLQLPW